MLSMILDFMGEYIEAKGSRLHWLGRERFAEMEHDFNNELNRIIENRVKIELEKLAAAKK